MFYAVQALLLLGGYSTSKHSGAISLFDREFVKTSKDPGHTYGSRLVRNRNPLYEVGGLMGQSDPKTTRIYAHLRPGDDMGVVETLNS